MKDVSIGEGQEDMHRWEHSWPGYGDSDVHSKQDGRALAILKLNTKLVKSRYEVVNTPVIFDICGARGSVSLSDVLASGLVDHASGKGRLLNLDEIVSLSDVVDVFLYESLFTIDPLSDGMELHCTMHLKRASAPVKLVTLAGMLVLDAFNPPSSNMKLYDVFFNRHDSATVYMSEPSDASHGRDGAISQTWTAINMDSVVDLAASDETGIDIGPVITEVTYTNEADQVYVRVNASHDYVFLVHNDYFVTLVVADNTNVRCLRLSPCNKPFIKLKDSNERCDSCLPTRVNSPHIDSEGSI